MAELKPLLTLLLDEASITFDEATLLPKTLGREGLDENITFLSGGMREQLAILTRLAFGVPPIFGGDPGIIHDKVVERMFDLLKGKVVPVYLDEAARQLLAEARLSYFQLAFERRGVSPQGENTYLVFTRRGTIATNSLALALALRGSGFKVEVHDGLLEVSGADTAENLSDYLQTLANGASPNLFVADTNLRFEKFDHFLSDALLQRNVLTSRLDSDCLADMAKTILDCSRR